MRALVFLATVLLATSSAASSSTGTFFALLQDPATGAASGVVYSTNGSVVAASALGWDFLWPLVEVSADTSTRKVFVVKYPYPTGNVTLYKISFDLTSMETLVSSGLGYFDLEYSAGQNTHYGVTVSSPYGRDISHFTDFHAPVQHTVITSLPYMWFVNASTFDSGSTRYLGLLNYGLPGMPNMTTQQQLAVGAYANPEAQTTTFLMLTLNTAQNVPTPLIRFISWSEPAQTLYGLAIDALGATILVSIDTSSGVFTELVAYQGSVAEPMVASGTAPELFAFVAADGIRQLLRFDVSTSPATVEVVYNYEDNALVSGMAWLS
jgi:hypothetical protein